ncbi:polyhydroxyalkanoate depolymerase [Pelagibius litoralis]|uniref:Polyhydroxyalkanoate depolymerase n=1 Tax=Pelagibius litoralis TaxID=374515 RepID=A0A967KDE2_9PROT|nr:polyhydroxyalkanoate depolymerase [Pelagibius litoralis]NIA70170.1 polyhydroxyalkanoate depolymerase [Pelagibius litoralis]
MLYHAYELTHAAVRPLRMQSDALQYLCRSAFSPVAYTPAGKAMAAACEVFENVTRRYRKPAWGIDEVEIDGQAVGVHPELVYGKLFCDLLHFKRDESVTGKRKDPKVLIVAPLSGHYATLLRGTVKAMIPEHEVYVTDWRDARVMPLAYGRFDLDDVIDYVMDFVRFIGPDTHVIAVCQPAVPVLAAAAVMAAKRDPLQPASMTLIGGPIDTRRNPTAVNDLAASRPLSWFEQSVILSVPFPNPGAMRRVYPGFVQLTGFMTMNLERHLDAHSDLFRHLIEGDCDSVEQHQGFYEEYRSVMDLTAEFYLQTIETVFQEHALPKGTMRHRGALVDCGEIRDTALMTIEGELDDICGLGQTEAAHDLCRNIPDDDRHHYVQPDVGHYGVFNGRRWRDEIQPRLKKMIRATERRRRSAAKRIAGA